MRKYRVAIMVAALCCLAASQEPAKAAPLTYAEGTITWNDPENVDSNFCFDLDGVTVYEPFATCWPASDCVAAGTLAVKAIPGFEDSYSEGLTIHVRYPGSAGNGKAINAACSGPHPREDVVSPLTGGLDATQVCGDTFLDEGEQCDDGNVQDGDGCSSSCQEETGQMSEMMAKYPLATVFVITQAFLLMWELVWHQISRMRRRVRRDMVGR